MKSFKTDFTRIRPDILKAFEKIPTSTISDALGRCGSMSSDIKPVYPDARLCGPAFTVRVYPSDNLMVHLALKKAKPGDILVIDSSGAEECALWGELMSLSANLRGLGGTVIDGGIRDKDRIAALKYPVFTKTVIPVGTHKVNQGSLCEPISCGGIPVFPGDIIFGDSDGVVTVPFTKAVNVLNKVREILDKENQMRKRIKKGEVIFDILGLEKYFKD